SRGVGCFVVGRREHSNAGMAPQRVVPAFYPLKDRGGKLGSSSPDFGVEEFELHGAPERLDQRVVIAIPDRAHGRHDSGIDQSPPERPRRELAAMCRIVDCRSGHLRMIAMPSASITSSVRMLSPIDQPTTRRENTSMTAAQYTFPSRVGCSVTSVHQISSGPSTTKSRSTRSTY